MPARDERIYLFPYRNGDPGVVMPFPYWWDRSKFIKKYQQREIECSNPIDSNFAWLLDFGEAIAWNEECVKEFASNPLSSKPQIIEAQQKLEDALRQSQWVIVESYEWES
jgi:hypothetical protein